MDKFAAIPQRSDGRGYVDCPLHRATSFAVYRVYPKRQRRFLSRHDNLTQAKAEVLYHNLRWEPQKRKPRKVIAASLSQDQYLALHPR